MQQGENLNVRPHILPPLLHGMPQHINHIGGQSSSQQLPQIVHHVGTQVGVPIGTKQPGGISSTQFVFGDETVYFVVKITHPDTHEGLRFDSNGKRS